MEVDVRQSILTLRITDDGTGFDEQRVQAGNGLGLMRRRAADIGGRLEITSCPGEGTHLVLVARI